MEKRIISFSIALALACLTVAAQPQRPQASAAETERQTEQRRAEELAEFVKANYTKYEYQIPMHDGIRLFTAVYEPKDFSEKWPVMLTRTPYSVGPYGSNNYKTNLGPSEKFARDKFIFVYQDVPGRYFRRARSLTSVHISLANEARRTSTDPATRTTPSSG